MSIASSSPCVFPQASSLGARSDPRISSLMYSGGRFSKSSFCKATSSLSIQAYCRDQLPAVLCSSGAKGSWRCKLTAGIRRQPCSVAVAVFVQRFLEQITFSFSFFSLLPRSMFDSSSGIQPFACTRACATRNLVAIWPCPVQIVQGH